MSFFMKFSGGISAKSGTWEVKCDEEPVNLLTLPYSPSSQTEELPPGVRFVLLSDTHGKHDAFSSLPEGDVLIHGGDFTNTGSSSQVARFVSWIDSQPYQYRVYIAGNHDTALDTKYYIDRGHARFHRNQKSAKYAEEISAECQDLVRNCKSTYLQDEGVELEFRSECDSQEIPSHKIMVYGTPWQPKFCDWAFNMDRGRDLEEMWQKIPQNTDVLISHGPPLGFGDKTISGFSCGCEDLLKNIRERSSPPRLHVFGHIHEDRGAWFDGHTLFINASSCTFNYQPSNIPICVHLPFDPSLPASIVHPDSPQYTMTRPSPPAISH